MGFLHYLRTFFSWYFFTLSAHFLLVFVLVKIALCTISRITIVLVSARLAPTMFFWNLSVFSRQPLAKCPVRPHLLHRSNNSLIFDSISRKSGILRLLLQYFHPLTFCGVSAYICLSVSSRSGPSPSPRSVPNLGNSLPVGLYSLVKTAPLPLTCCFSRPFMFLDLPTYMYPFCSSNTYTCALCCEQAA